MFGRQTRKTEKLSPKRAEALFELAKKQQNVRVFVLCSNYFWLFHHFGFGATATASVSLAFCISLSISLIFVSWSDGMPYMRRNVCATLQLTGTISLLNTLTRCIFTCFIIFTTRSEGKRNNLIFPLRNFSRYGFFLLVTLLHYTLSLQAVPELNCSMCCWYFMNSERWTPYVTFVFSLYFAYVLLHHFNCFQTQAAKEKKKKN